MKKSFLLLFCTLLLATNSMSAADLTGKKIYVNPGHGHWGPNARPQSTIPYRNLTILGMPDTCGFYESNTNLWKCLYLGKKLQQYGAEVTYSHIDLGFWYEKKDGDYPDYDIEEYMGTDEYKSRDSSDARKAIAEAAEIGNCDCFISVHSNAPREQPKGTLIEEALSNYPLFLYKGYDGGANTEENKSTEYYAPGSYEMAAAAWPHAYKLLEGISSPLHPDKNQTASISNPQIRGDYDYYNRTGIETNTFNGKSYHAYLGVIRHGVPGFLVEGFHHTYGPARHRALNRDYCNMEGLAYFRGIMDYFDAAPETVGYICGVIKDNTTKMFDHPDYQYHPDSHDQWMPCNGATVILKKNGVEVDRYTCDNNYNGIFVFYELEPGTYTLESERYGLTFSETVEVTADETTYTRLYPNNAPQAAPAGTNLNIYASGLKVSGLSTDRKVKISYFLNAPATTLEFQLLLGEDVVYSQHLYGACLQKGAHEGVEIDLANTPDGNYTWALVAHSATANTSVTKVSDDSNRFKFFSPTGLAIDNNPNSPFYGRIYVTESREGQGQSEIGRTTHQGIYIFGADLSDITKQEDSAYHGGVKWSENLTTQGDNPAHAILSPARITVGEDGYLYICDNAPVSYGDKTKSGVWRMNPAAPQDEFTEILDTEKCGTKYTRINSIAVTGFHDKKRMWAIDNSQETDSKTHLVSYAIEDSAKYNGTRINTIDISSYVKNHHNTLVRGAHDDFWIFQYREGDNSIPAITHIDKNNNITNALSVSYLRRGGGAVSPDGTVLAFNGNNTQHAIRLFKITYNNNKPTLTEIEILKISNSGKNVDGVAFDAANNLYFTSASNSRFYAYALPKANNTHTTKAPDNQHIMLATPRIMAYNLRMERIDTDYHFSFYANSTATEAKLVFYTDDINSPVGEYPLSNITEGTHSVVIPTHKIPVATNEPLQWAVQLTGAKTIFGEIYQQDQILNRAHAVIDNSPESDFFGRIYIGNRIAIGEGEALVLNPDYSIKERGLLGMDQLNSAARPAVDAEGYIYWADFGDTHSGVWVTNPKTLRTESFFDGNPNKDGVWSNNGVPMGGSCVGTHIYGSGNDTKLYMLNEDAASGTPNLPANGYLVFDIGQEDGSILRKWDKAPSQAVSMQGNKGANFSIVGTSHGAFICQNRNKNYNNETARSLQFYDNSGNCKYNSANKSTIINGSFGGGMAVSADETKLAMVNGDGNILIFDITWNGDTPDLIKNTEYQTNYTAISTMHFDYAGNLIVAAGQMGYASSGFGNDLRLVVFSLPTNDNTVIVPAQTKQTLSKTITLLDTKDNSELLDDHMDSAQHNALVCRSLTAGMFNTLCLPFDASLTDGPLAGAKAYTFSSSSETEGGDILLHFSKATEIEAGVPYLIEPQTNIQGPIDFTNVTISTAEGSSTGSSTDNDIKFNGILAPKWLEANNKNILFLVSDNKLAWANANANMNGMRAYFSLPDGAYNKLNTRARIVVSENTTTDIQQTTTTSTNAQKLIRNGMLYILKDGQLYTVFGTKVK